MQTENNRIEILFKRYLDGSIAGEEYNEFWQLLNEQNLKALTPQLQTLWLQTEGAAPVYTDEEWNRKLKALIQKAEEEDRMKLPGAKVIPMYRRKAFKYIAAAAIIVMIVGGWWMIESKRPGARGEKEVATTHDVPAPTNTRAVITLADGSKIYLDSAGNGTIAQQNDVAVVKDENGGIKYLSPAGGGAGGMSPSGGGAQRAGEDYNTLFNPRGSKVISLTLSDGTRVWLNSESSLRYPASFVSNTREVEITGEAYFEVKHNSKQPFKVHLPNGSIVEDIGTAFNINAYPDEEATKTTLIEGSIKISAQSADKNLRNQREKILKPGEQLVQSPDHQITTSPDIDEVMAWKNGQFNLQSTGLAMLMRQIARWYDVDVEYKNGIPQNKFGGSLSRDLSLGTLLKALQQSGINAQLEGRKIIVK